MLEVSNGWFADYSNGSQFFTKLYASTAIDPSCCNGTLVGASPDQLRSLGRNPIEVPSVDDRIEACQRTIGTDEATCWAELDQFMMEQVVPAVPILIPGVQTPIRPGCFTRRSTSGPRSPRSIRWRSRRVLTDAVDRPVP